MTIKNHKMDSRFKKSRNKRARIDYYQKLNVNYNAGSEGLPKSVEAEEKLCPQSHSINIVDNNYLSSSDTSIQFHEVEANEYEYNNNVNDPCGNEINEISILNIKDPIEQFRDIVLKNQLTHVATNDILKFIKNNYDSKFPSDARTLLNTPSGKPIVKEISGGLYYHFSVRNSIVSYLNHIEVQDKVFFNQLVESGIHLKLNCDGLPIHKSSCSQFWVK